MIDISGKKILFIAPKFFGYELEIKKELESFGAEVTFFGEKTNSLYYRIAKQISKKFQIRLEKKYLNSILSKVDKFDIFFLIRGEIITKKFLEALKTKNPNAKFVMYQWDSLKNNPNYYQLLSYFDKVSTFDMVDAKELNIGYLPLFYTSKYKNLKHSSKKIFDIVFFGSYHGDRLEVIKQVDGECMRLGLSFKHHLFIHRIALLKRLLLLKIKFSDLRYLTTKSVSTEEILETYKVSRAVLDIENQGQNGLTMRTFEVLGCGSKLITTNENILKEDFYDLSNVLLLNRGQIKIDKKFLKKNINLERTSKFYINNWILDATKIS